MGFGSSWAGSKRECGGEQAASGLVTVAQERRGGPLVAGLCGRGSSWAARLAGPAGPKERKRENGVFFFQIPFYFPFLIQTKFKT